MDVSAWISPLDSHRLCLLCSVSISPGPYVVVGGVPGTCSEVVWIVIKG